MKPQFSLLLALLGLPLLGMASKPPVIIRFYVEANANDTDHFATPIDLHHPDRKAFIEKVPVIHERMIKAVYPYETPDGTWGCALKLDENGRIDLEVASTEHRSGTMVVFVGTKTGTHQVVDMLIDKPIKDGVINVPYGLTHLEVEALAQEFGVIGQKKKK